MAKVALRANPNSAAAKHRWHSGGNRDAADSKTIACMAFATGAKAMLPPYSAKRNIGYETTTPVWSGQDRTLGGIPRHHVGDQA